MYTESEGIILRQIKALGGRRMILVFTEKYGKISAGTSISERGKNKSALALRPFTYGRYELFKGRESYSINGAEVIRSFYEIGENVDKYLAASYALELTDAMLEDEQPSPGLFSLLIEYLSLLPGRAAAFDTLLAAFMLKALSFAGCAPSFANCCGCGRTDGLTVFSIPAGGMLCSYCRQEESGAGTSDSELIGIMRYMSTHSLQNLRELALQPDTERTLKNLLRSYYAWHLGIDKLRSEGFTM